MEFRGQKLSLRVTGAALHKYIGVLDLYKHPTVVVRDEVYQCWLDQAGEGDADSFHVYQFDDDMLSGSTVDAIGEFIPDRFDIGGLPGNMSYIGIYRANFALFGSYAFIGFFLGALFMLASCSVMYYKLIMEAQEEVPRYELLRKSGLKYGEALAAIAKQQGLVFGAPLLVGALHTAFGLAFYGRAMGEIGQQTPIMHDAVVVALLCALVYGLFYALSVVSCRRIVWRSRS